MRLLFVNAVGRRENPAAVDESAAAPVVAVEFHRDHPGEFAGVRLHAVDDPSQPVEAAARRAGLRRSASAVHVGH